MGDVDACDEEEINVCELTFCTTNFILTFLHSHHIFIPTSYAMPLFSDLVLKRIQNVVDGCIWMLKMANAR